MVSSKKLQIKPNCLLVDDDFKDHQLIKKTFSNEFLIDYCFNYESALEKIATTQYDLIFIDLVLNDEIYETSGLDLIPFAKTMQVSAKIVAITKYLAEDSFVKKAKKIADGLLLKANYHPIKWRKAIEKILNNASKEKNTID